MPSSTKETEQAFSTFLTERRTSLQSIVEDELPSEDVPNDQRIEKFNSPFNYEVEKSNSFTRTRTDSFNHALSSGTPTEHRIQQTAEDASISKLSAVTLGYYEDPYLHFFVRQPCQRSPLINRGYFSRVAAIRKAIASFFLSMSIETNVIQLVNLGGGLETLYFWLSDFFSTYRFHLFEVDYPNMLSKKLSIMMRRQPLREKLELETPYGSGDDLMASVNNEDACIKVSKSYTMIPVDMRQLSYLDSILRESDFNPDHPTLFISECVLVYLSPTESDGIISWAAQLVKGPSAFVIYEQINPDDTFGSTMVRMMEQRGFPLLGIHAYPTVKAQSDRFTSRGWSLLTAVNMNQFYEELLDKYELIRVQSLELLDEMEEWKLIQAHYIILIAVKNLQEPSTHEPHCCKDQDDRGANYITRMKSIWEHEKHECQQLPRFSTEEFRQNSQAIQSMYSRGFVKNSNVKPGLLSLLLCPHLMSLHSSDLEMAIGSGRWTLPYSQSGLVKAVREDQP